MDLNHQLDHHQPSQSQPHAGPNNQLPDESYIEKLFPKCQPKSAQARGANQHQFRNRRTMRETERQQQHQRRQNHGKQQRQQHQQQPQQQLFRHESARPPRRSRSTTDENTLSMMGKGANSLNTVATGIESSGLSLNLATSARNNSSSDSSDKDTNANGQPNVRRSNSSHVAFATNGQQPDPNPTVSSQCNNSGSRRTKKYRASKNLQQQLKRSQSSYSKLINNQPLPVNASNKQDEKQQSGLIRSDQNEVAISTSQSNHKRNHQTAADGTPNDRNSSRELPVGGRRQERGNRTNRGIVFAEPIATTTNIEPEPSSVSSQQPTLNETISPSAPQSTTPNVGEHEVKTAAASSAPVKTRQHAQQTQASSSAAASKTAVVLSSKAEADGGGGQVAPAEIDGTVTEIIHPVNRDHSNTEQTSPAAQRSIDQKALPAVVSQCESVNCETIAKLDNAENDDRFINLFVYDNTSPRKHDEVKESDKVPLITFNQSDSTIRNYPEANNNTARERDLKTSSRHLLAVDLDEENLISNDTSTEELCSFSDQYPELGLSKIKPTQSRPLKKTPDDSRLQDKAADRVPDIAPSAPNKSILKHHRSLSTLQTVDEKAEINIEEEKNNNNINDSTSQTPQVEPSETTMIKKSFVPPGFPQRIRPSPVDLGLKDQPQPQQATCATHVPDVLSPTSGNIAPIETANQSTADQVRERNEPIDRADESLPCLQLDNASMRNLSEALTKVHLETNVTLRQLKLPNEASHFSAIRPTISQSTSHDTQHHPSIQFNTLSDAESGADDDPNSNPRQSVNSAKAYLMQKRQQDFVPSSSSITHYASPGSSSRADDDLAPATRTALVFPRLDEGLSSEAESCDDEVDDDDDKAMEADVDADDDDDDEEDDDDVEDNLNLDKDSIPKQANVDHQFQHQSVKPQNRRIGNIQLQSSVPGGAQPRLAELNQVKFNEFSQQESLEQEDLKPLTNYANQNGQSNYWLGGSNQQTATSSQSVSSFSRMQHGQSNSASNNVNLSRSINYANREDVKTANRLSSDTDNETDRLLGSQRNDQLQKMVANELSSNNSNEQQATNSFSTKQGANSREVLIEGVLFNVKYLGSTHTECEGRGEKEDRIHQAELAVHEVKFRNGETHSPVEVQLFISTEKIMVLDDKHRKIMMDHSLRTISYIADIGDAIVLIVRKKSTSIDNNNELSRPISKTSCHVFESNESHTITKSISQAFQVAYTELLKANSGADGNSYLPKELDYQEVLNSQEMSTTELEMFARKENQREVIVPKRRGEILGLSIVESGWGSVLPTAVIASLKQDGPAYRCKKLSVGDQILSINGISLVGLSLAECQKILRKTKGQSVARLSVVPCPITVEVKIKRPDTKYQLGFSVQHGVICSLLRGGIAERGGVRVGHRIISINGTTVVGVPHDKIVTLLASSVGEIRMKTCLTSLYRHMLGEEKNVSFV